MLGTASNSFGFRAIRLGYLLLGCPMIGLRNRFR